MKNVFSKVVVFTYLDCRYSLYMSNAFFLLSGYNKIRSRNGKENILEYQIPWKDLATNSKSSDILSGTLLKTILKMNIWRWLFHQGL